MKEKEMKNLEKQIAAAIAEREKTMLALSEELSRTREEIRNLDGQIKAFDDIANAEQYSKLKEDRKTVGERLELLEKRYREETSGPGKDLDKRREEYAQFKSMAKSALNDFEKDAGDLIAELQTKFDLAEGKLSSIISLHSKWATAYNIKGSLEEFSPRTNAVTMNRIRQFLYRENYIRTTGI